MLEKVARWFNLFRLASPALEQRFHIFTDEASVCILQDKTEQTIFYSDILKIALINTDQGPFTTDVFWLIETASSKVIIPQGSAGEDPMLKQFQKIFNFNNQAVIDSASCAGNRTFVCWQKEV